MIGKAVMQNDRKIAYIAPTYQQARDIAWNELKRIAEPVLQSVNESRLELVLETQHGGTSTIILRGWESVETLRGQAFDFVVIDEIAMMRNWNYNWSEVIRPTLTDRNGHALFISTPKGFNHFYDLFNKEKADDDYRSFHFTSYDNPHLPKKEIDKAKEELSEDAFAQEYMADFRKATGLAHKMWNRDIHLIKPFDVPKEWQRGRGFDYGTVDPTASARVAIHEDVWFIERCYKNGEQYIYDHAHVIKSQDYGYPFMPIFGDPSGKQWAKEFSRLGVNIEPARKETGQKSRGWVEHSVELINQRLKPVVGHEVHLPDGRVIKDAPKLFVLDTEENRPLIQEIEVLRWKETNVGTTVPILDEEADPNGHCDLMAALRYFAVSYTGTHTLEEKMKDFQKQQLFDNYGVPI